MEVDIGKVSPGVRLVRPPDPPGKLVTMLTVIDGQIVLDFGQVLQWVAFEPAQAEKLANEILDAVRTARTLILPTE